MRIRRSDKNGSWEQDVTSCNSNVKKLFETRPVKSVKVIFNDGSVKRYDRLEEPKPVESVKRVRSLEQRVEALERQVGG